MMDTIIVSGISGSLNMIDVPSYAKELAGIACKLCGEKLPAGINMPKPGEVLLDFALPGSTHGMRLSDNYANFVMRQTTERAHSGCGCLGIVFEHIMPDPQSGIYLKQFYRRDDFDDERYSPVFSPVVYSGQKVQLFANLELLTAGSITLMPYVHLSMQDQDILLEPVNIQEDHWTQITFEIPETNGDVVDEIGVKLSSFIDSRRVYGRLFIDDFTVTGGSKYRVDMSMQRSEFGQITPFSYNQCECAIDNEWLLISAYDEAQVFTGNYYSRNVTVDATVKPILGEKMGLIVAGQGAERYYELGFSTNGKAAVICHDYGERVITETDFMWERGKEYRMKASLAEGELKLYINGELLVSAKDSELTYGMVGFYCNKACSMRVKGLHVIADKD